MMLEFERVFRTNTVGQNSGVISDVILCVTMRGFV